MTRPFVAAAALLLGALLASFWLIGDQSTTTLARDHLDYVVRLDLPRWLVVTMGVGGVAAVVAGTVLLVRLRLVLPELVTVVALFGLAGCILGAGLRVVTAGVIGANIGVGLFMMFGLPLLVFLIIRGIAALQVAVFVEGRDPR